MTNRRGRRNSKTPAPNGKVMIPTKDFSQMRHRYYVVRPEPNKKCVPLVALDELPEGFRLKNVPLTVTPQQILEWDMARVGTDIELKDSFEVDFDRLAPPQNSPQPSSDEQNSTILKKSEVSNEAIDENLAMKEEQNSKKAVEATGSVKLDDPDKPEPVGGKTETDWRPVSELQRQANDAANEFVEQSKREKENDHSKTHNAATPGVYGKKKFCTHWIRTGNCDYMQEGCRYLHVIPDAETRLRIGIRDMPRWAKEDLPSPPREIHRARRHSSTPPKEGRKDTHKDWRNRGNRKAHADLPAGPPLTRPAPLRSLIPTPQSATQMKQRGPQRGLFQTQTISPFENAHTNFLAAQNGDISHYESASSGPFQQNAQSSCYSNMGPQTIQPATPAVAQQSAQGASQQASTSQGSVMRQQQLNPLLSNSSPLPIQSPPLSGFHDKPSFHNHTRLGYGPSAPTGNYSAFRSPQQSITATPFGSGEARLDGGRWGYPSYQSQSIIGHPLMQSRPTPVTGSSTPGPWFQGLLNSPTPSFSDASIGTIGHGRPTNSSHSPSSPIPGAPVMHKRLFRQPGESQYVEAQPEPEAAKSKGSDCDRSHKGKGMTAFEGAGENGSRSGQLGNLIALDG